MSKPAIECRTDGPYLVKDLETFANSRGEPIAGKAVMALCRCGGSATKPFCDGTHKKNGFSGAGPLQPGTAKRDVYGGRKITIYDDRAICAHSGRCSDNLAAVFKYGSEPWIDPDAASVEAIIEAVRKCPSGALNYALDGIEARSERQPPAISITKDGPYAVVGAIALAGQAVDAMAATHSYTLCRCGGSKNKPFCDGTHWSIEFRDEGN